MAWAYDNSAIATPSSSSFSYTIGGGANRLLVVAVIWETSGTGNAAVTFNDVTMTPIPTTHVSNGNTRGQLFYLLEANLPAAGSYTVSSAIGVSGYLIAASYSGVSQSAPQATNSLNGASLASPQTVSLSPTSANGLAVALASINNAITLSATGGCTVRHQNNTQGSGQTGGFCDKSMSGSGDTIGFAGSTTFNRIVIVGAAWEEAVAGPVYTQTKFRLYNDDGAGLGEAP